MALSKDLASIFTANQAETLCTRLDRAFSLLNEAQRTMVDDVEASQQISGLLQHCVVYAGFLSDVEARRIPADKTVGDMVLMTEEFCQLIETTFVSPDTPSRRKSA
jgi:hypothetical protein